MTNLAGGILVFFLLITLLGEIGGLAAVALLVIGGLVIWAQPKPEIKPWSEADEWNTEQELEQKHTKNRRIK